MPRAAPIRRTRLVRISEDLAEILGTMSTLDGPGTAVFLDPFIRPPIEAWAKRNRRRVESLKELRTGRAGEGDKR
jgi:hypothetical protein